MDKAMRWSERNSCETQLAAEKPKKADAASADFRFGGNRAIAARALSKMNTMKMRLEILGPHPPWATTTRLRQQALTIRPAHNAFTVFELLVPVSDLNGT